MKVAASMIVWTNTPGCPSGTTVRAGGRHVVTSGWGLGSQAAAGSGTGVPGSGVPGSEAVPARHPWTPIRNHSSRPYAGMTTCFAS